MKQSLNCHSTVIKQSLNNGQLIINTTCNKQTQTENESKQRNQQPRKTHF